MPIIHEAVWLSIANRRLQAQQNVCHCRCFGNAMQCVPRQGVIINCINFTDEDGGFLLHYNLLALLKNKTLINTSKTNTSNSFGQERLQGNN